jgi:ABC-type polysaccharide/polyol phosphate transport system ATPase subunit
MSSEGPQVVQDGGEAALILRNVSKRYRMSGPALELKTALLHPLRAYRSRGQPFWAVRGVNLEVEKGEFFSIIGANGSGKSTLLRLVAGLSQATEGSVVARGRMSTLLELGSGFHPQVSGRENAILNGLLIGMTRAEIEGLLPEIVAFAGLQEFINQPMRTYSSGMYVRLGFAVAAYLDPEILLVDEVLAVGDAKFQEKCYDHIAGLQRRGVTIMMVSHDLGAVERFSTRAALMERGRIVSVGDPKGVVAEHMERLISTSPEIRRAVEEAMVGNPEAVERRLAESPEAKEAFDRALAQDPTFKARAAGEGKRPSAEEPEAESR